MLAKPALGAGYSFFVVKGQAVEMCSIS